MLSDGSWMVYSNTADIVAEDLTNHDSIDAHQIQLEQSFRELVGGIGRTEWCHL